MNRMSVVSDRRMEKLRKRSELERERELPDSYEKERLKLRKRYPYLHARLRWRRLKKAEMLRQRLAEENLLFRNRLQFERSRVWDWNRLPEERSLCRSSWPGLVEACRLWGPPWTPVRTWSY